MMFLDAIPDKDEVTDDELVAAGEKIVSLKKMLS